MEERGPGQSDRQMGSGVQEIDTAAAEPSQSEFSGAPVVILASATWASPLPLNVHQVARRLAARGHPVLFVESTGLRVPSPFRSGHDRKRILRRLRDLWRGARGVAPGLHVLSPLALPGARSPWLRRLSLWALAYQVRRGARRLEMDTPVLWAFLPTAMASITALRPRLVVYHCVDHYAANPGVDADWVAELEAALLERADLVLGTSAPLVQRLAQVRTDARLVENVADVALFRRAVDESLAEPQTLASLSRPRAIYTGNLARYRIETSWLEQLARSIPELQLVFVGPQGLGERDSLPLTDLPNTHLIPAVPAAELPRHLQFCDVALIPFQDNEHTRSSFPLKFWEYVAAGLPVVSRDLASLHPTAEGMEGVWLAQDAESFVRGVREALANPSWDRARQSECARNKGWEERMELLSRYVDEALASRGRSELRH